MATTRLVCENCGKTGHFPLNRVSGPKGKRMFVCEQCTLLLAAPASQQKALAA